MNKNNISLLRISLVLFVCLIAFSSAVFSQTTAFTYQGRLTDQSADASGSYLMKFELYDAATGGTLVDTLTDVPASVSNGVFTVGLSFAAANAFDGGDRYLQISVKRNAGDAYTTLAPRQQITSTPYAIRARNAGAVETATAGNSVVNSINNAATNTTINSDRLAADVVRLKPAATQTSTTTDGDAPMLDVTGAVTDGSGNPPQTARFRMNHSGAFGIYRHSYPFDPIIKLTRDGLLTVSGVYNGDIGGDIYGVDGAGTRLMWSPGKAAFRAGYVNGTQWDAANIGNYSTAFGQDVRASGDYSFAAGKFSNAAINGAVALGEGTIASGLNSVALGYGAQTNGRQGSFVFADRSIPLIYDSFGNILQTNSEFFRAAVNHSANWRVSGGFRVFTSSNLSTGVTFQNGSVASNWCNGQTNAVISTSTCAYLSTSGIWTNNSSADLKTNFAPLDARSVLQKVLGLSIQSWNYKVDAPNVRHIGATAQDFYRAFGVGADDRHITPIDTAGVTMLAIQGLNEELREELKTRDRSIDAQKAKVERLEMQVERQQKQIDELKKIVCAVKSDAAICGGNQ